LNAGLNAATVGTELKELPYGTFMPDPGKQLRRDKTEGQEPSSASSDERLLEAASLNPSLAGRELLIEILAQGPEPEETERPRATDVRAAFRSRSLDDPDYRTAAEQAD